MTLPVVPETLHRLLTSLDRKGYKAYKALQGRSFDFSPFRVTFEHVQGDPFAAPSRISVSLDAAAAGFSPSYFSTPVRRLALEDHLLRGVNDYLQRMKFSVRGSGKSGVVSVQVPGQKVLKRSALLVDGGRLTLVQFAGLPAQGRTILGQECLRLFSDLLPPLWQATLLADSLDLSRLDRAVHTLEDYDVLQAALRKNDWVSFVANGSILPRASGVSDRPLRKKAVPFRAPGELSAAVELPHAGRVEGMPLPRGITLIVGGGFHGKSTLLRAVQTAVYPHVPGDGRERIATLPSAVKIRAEDGRMVHPIDLSGFMKHLPGIESTQSFSTPSASGSTSQAVNILEAIEAGSELLLMDEDTCATNFMIRDGRMQTLIASHLEPITPFLDRVDEIHQKLGISSLLVMGGSGDYFEPADPVIAMENFRPRLVTREAKRIIRNHPVGRKKESTFPFPPVKARRSSLDRLNFSRGKKETVIQTQRLVTLILGRTEVDTRSLEQLVEEGQLEMCGWILRRLKGFQQNNGGSHVEGLRRIFADLDRKGFLAVAPFNNGVLTLPRLQDVLAVLYRIR